MNGAEKGKQEGSPSVSLGKLAMSCPAIPLPMMNELKKSIRGVLNNKDFQGKICPGLDFSSTAPGRFKKVCPARPQPFLRAERTRRT